MILPPHSALLGFAAQIRGCAYPPEGWREQASQVPDDRLRAIISPTSNEGSLLLWLDNDMNWQAPTKGKRGRQPTFSDAAIQFCLTIKCLFGLALALLHKSELASAR